MTASTLGLSSALGPSSPSLQVPCKLQAATSLLLRVLEFRVSRIRVLGSRVLGFRVSGTGLLDSEFRVLGLFSA